LKTERQKVENKASAELGKLSFSDAWQLYRERVAVAPEIKPSTRKYHQEILEAIQKTWPDFRSDIKRTTKSTCLEWRNSFAQRYSETRINGAISVLKRIFEIAVERGVLYENPAKTLPRARVRQKELQLPEPAHFEAFVRSIETAGGSTSRHCANLVRFLAFGGFRISEAARITWADCNLEKSEITVRGDPETGTKNWSIRRVPMIDEMKALLEKLRLEAPNEPGSSGVMRVHECQKAMDRAAKEVGMIRITHHDLRHLFATRCIESGVDIPTVSRWLGHKDGGALAMRVYGHLRDQHSAEMAGKVRFSSKPEDFHSVSST
jgi:integrase